MDVLDQEWLSFSNGNNIFNKKTPVKKISKKTPKCSDIYISTKTKIAYLNQKINLQDSFWKLPTINYHEPINGIIKKSMKINCLSKQETDALNEKLEKCVKYNSINQISFVNSSRIYKDVKKINIGMCKTDLLSYRKKNKGAFYNCFALIFRIKFNGIYKEVHVKVFNTGKLEIPGIQDDKLMYLTFEELIPILKSLNYKNICVIGDKIQNVLINSNFNCGFYINRNKLFEILKYDYKIHSLFDPCSYPGIQSKFYYNKKYEVQKGLCLCDTKCCKKKPNRECYEISFMIFRTGSILIVGHCDEYILNKIYNFLKELLRKEYNKIYIENADGTKKKKSKPKIRKKKILFIP
jgi:TATA-box binding protein (TBP) (component of TFIID and TFIIIB)